MTSTFRKIILLCLICPLLVHTQTDERSGPNRNQNPPVQYEAISLFGPDTSRGIVNVHYRILQSYFIFVKSEKDPRVTEYRARGELLIELLNEHQVSMAREIRPIVSIRSTLPRENENIPDVQGAASFSVPPGEYKIVFSLDDRNSGRSFLEQHRTVTVMNATFRRFELSSPLVAYSASASDSIEPPQFIPFNRGSSVPFGSKGGYLFQIFRPSSDVNLIIRWSIKGRSEFVGVPEQTFSGNQYLFSDGLLTLDRQGDRLAYVMKRPDSGWNALFIPLPLHRLDPGIFSIQVDFAWGKSEHSAKYQFAVNWPDRPASLRNFELAVDAVRHIATDEEMGEMLSGSTQNRGMAFARFWRSRDPDTTTAYNQVMAEYYRRVDEALLRYSTDSGGDGYKTDRGRTYIFYGAPTRIERVLQPGAKPKEIWSYDLIGRKFVFVDYSKTGNFQLTETDSL